MAWWWVSAAAVAAVVALTAHFEWHDGLPAIGLTASRMAAAREANAASLAGREAL
eukprot:CAMPEP_0174839924 /NCGR_PEP_ID=MMETSP1114-20130205/8354_1 /TAXON_ID=312471 /ORGANISM="Neobodo designis, Strain CCAP 1951/1" /LENGTH=54 /DNA_ID=CAMNT_0016074053 /DNA_START=47 /DNA_END=208 /DNA_ORIENTATION=+